MKVQACDAVLQMGCAGSLASQTGARSSQPYSKPRKGLQPLLVPACVPSCCTYPYREGTPFTIHVGNYWPPVSPLLGAADPG